MTARTRQPRAFTGRHMLAAMAAFFGAIIAVNLTMAVFAMTSWTGLVVKNAYVASQEFNAHASAAREQAALGWRGELAYEKGSLRYRLTSANGAVVAATGVEVALGRPAYEAEDITIRLLPTGDGGFGGEIALADGQWIARLSAEAGLSRPWLDIRRIHVRDGAVQ